MAELREEKYTGIEEDSVNNKLDSLLFTRILGIAGAARYLLSQSRI